MREEGRLLAAALVLCTASPALAVERGGTLYVKVRDTRLMPSTSPTATPIALLQPGAEVEWQGADSTDKRWHHVVVNEKKGLVFQSNLSTQPPRMELISKGGVRKVDPVAFANSAAAIKGLSKGAVAYGNGKQGPGYSQAVKQIDALERLANKVTPEAIEAHAKKAGLHPVVLRPKRVAKAGGK